MRIGQGVGWGDVQLYQANGLSVGEAQYNDLFALTANARFDLFPRGIGEVFDEYAAQKDRHPHRPQSPLRNGLAARAHKSGSKP